MQLPIILFVVSLFAVVLAEADCDIPEAPEHGTVMLTGEPKVGVIALFACNEDKTLVGSSASKCLVTGQWTFPPPKCLGSCPLPEIVDSIMGHHEMVYTNHFTFYHQFVKHENGTIAKHGDIVTVLCNEGFIAAEMKETSERKLSSSDEITCEDGKWSKDLQCRPASCFGDAPPIENGYPVVSKRTHGHVIYYKCNENYTKAKSDHVECIYGMWKGPTAVCVDARCYISQLNVPGLVTPQKEFFLHPRPFLIYCKQGYRKVASKRAKITCDRGSWKIPKETCVEEDRCFLKDLQHQTGVSPNTPSVTFPGDRLSVLCYDGYEPRSSLPMCLNGTWTHRTESPCKEKDCTVEWIPYGIMKKQTVGPERCNWFRFNCRTPITYTNVPIDSVSSTGTSLFLFCNYGYSLQGKGIISAEIHCSQGRWSPDPVCLLNGMKYIPTTKAFQVTTQTYNRMTQSTSPRTTALQTPIFTTPTSRVVSITSVFTGEKLEPEIESKTTTKQPTEEDICSCEYTLNDGDVVAYLDGKQLEFHEKVTRGKTVKFRCKNVAFQKLVGSREITCEDCQPWHSSVFPQCDDPKIDITCPLIPAVDSLEVSYTNGRKVGSIATFHCSPPAVLAGRTTTECLGNGTWAHPRPTCEDSGCLIGELSESLPEPVIPNMEGVEEELQSIGSELQLLCEGNLLLVGDEKARCGPRGKWQYGRFQCVRSCHLGIDGDSSQLIIEPSKQHFRFGEFVIFSCLPGHKLNSEVVRIMCMGTEWSDAIPDCVEDAVNAVDTEKKEDAVEDEDTEKEEYLKENEDTDAEDSPNV